MPGEHEPKQLIVVGVDGSDPSRDALAWAAGQAALNGSRLRVVMCWQEPVSYGWPVAYPEDFDPELETMAALRSMVGEVLGEAAAEASELIVEQGHPGPILVAAARQADLLVVGNRGHGAFTGMILGSVSEFCAAHSPVPVVIVRHAEPSPTA